MQLYSRIVVNLLVILVNIPVDLLVKLTRMKVRGGHGAPPGNTLGRGSYDLPTLRI